MPVSCPQLSGGKDQGTIFSLWIDVRRRSLSSKSRMVHRPNLMDVSELDAAVKFRNTLQPYKCYIRILSPMPMKYLHKAVVRNYLTHHHTGLL